MDTLQFTFTDADILKEVTKRTSFLGKSRGTEQQAHLLDRLSLTEGESFLFDEFMDDAITEVYDWIKAFGRGINNACTHNNGTLVFTVYKTDHFDENMTYLINRNLFSAIVNYIIFRWLEYVFPAEAKVFFDKFEENAQSAKNGLDCEDHTIVRPYTML